MAADYRISRVSCWAVIVFFLHLTHAFYIPGWSIRSYAPGQTLPLFVNKIYSDHSQIKYAYAELPFVCPPSGRVRPGTGLISGSNVALNLGEVLRGDRIVVSDHELEMGRDEELRYLCAKTVDEEGLRRAVDVVKKGYVAEWIVDNLPGATSFVSVDRTRKYYAAGFKMGYETTDPSTGRPRYFLNNHVTIVIRHRTAPGRAGERGRKAVIGFEVYARSIEAANRDANGLPHDLSTAHPGLELTLTQNSTLALNSSSASSVDPSASFTIPYTYSVYFRDEPHILWSNRWDLYFVNQDSSSQIHWLAILNSLVISALLSAVVLVILARTIRADLQTSPPSVEDGLPPEKKTSPSSPPPSSSQDDPEDPATWRRLSSDVFRPPPHGHLLAPLLGSGLQLLCMTAGLLVLSAAGVLNPSWRGGFACAGAGLFLVAGLGSGYFSGRAYRTFVPTETARGGTALPSPSFLSAIPGPSVLATGGWRANALLTAGLFPLLAFAVVFVLNLLAWARASSTALPLGTLLALVALWLGVQVPLVYAGAWLGSVRVGPWTHPTRVAQVARAVPGGSRGWYGRAARAVLLAGLVPFAVIFVELLFVFRSVWQDKSGYYYVFGFLGVVSVVTVLAVVETTIIAVYVQLCAEDYHWWWQSFFLGGASSLWVLVYCIYYYMFHLHITGAVSTILFFAYSFLACLVYALLTGTIGFLTAYAFVTRIYGAIKID